MFVLAILIATSVISMQLLKNKVNNSTIKYAKEETIPANSSTSNEQDKSTNNDKSPEEIKSINLMVLGEIMMGGKVSKNLEYDYLMAFKDIYEKTKETDFTYANFSTNITNLDSIDDARSEYLVTKDVLNALNALGVDALSIANDHITDFPGDIIKNTVNILEENNIFVAGRENMPVYFEKGGKKIAIVSTNSVIIGTSSNYTKNGISLYEQENIKKNIAEAKKMADFVIADIHWGKGESSFGITEQMKEMAKFVIDNGADLVMGTHAIGIQPIEIYNNKPIIYTSGYLITDLEYETTKVSYMFNLNFNEDVKLTEIAMTPIYIKDQKETLLYKNCDEVQANINMKSLNSRNIENGINSNIENDKIIIRF